MVDKQSVFPDLSSWAKSRDKKAPQGTSNCRVNWAHGKVRASLAHSNAMDPLRKSQAPSFSADSWTDFLHCSLVFMYSVSVFCLSQKAGWPQTTRTLMFWSLRTLNGPLNIMLWHRGEAYWGPVDWKEGRRERTPCLDQCAFWKLMANHLYFDSNQVICFPHLSLWGSSSLCWSHW